MKILVTANAIKIRFSSLSNGVLIDYLIKNLNFYIGLQ
jgi:hypothetical protein